MSAAASPRQPQAAAFDVNSACAGFIAALTVANQFIGTATTKNIGGWAENLSKMTDYKDRNTCILFSDGAGAFVVEASEEKRRACDGNRRGRRKREKPDQPCVPQRRGGACKARFGQ